MAGLKAPFSWYGSKSRSADLIWSMLGAPKVYAEPFAGSLAVLLRRPPTAHRRPREMVVDIDHHIVNFWRAVKADPEAVARNVAGNVGDQETLPGDHPGRAWGKTMWCELWGGCHQIERPKELDIMLRVSPTNNITMSDNSSSATGTEFEVTRRYGSWPDSVAISHDQPCPSFGHSYSVTIPAQIMIIRELN